MARTRNAAGVDATAAPRLGGGTLQEAMPQRRRHGDAARRAGRDQPCRRPPAVAPDYWITWSARCSSDRGIVRPRAFAVLRLITSSNFVGCSTGRSPGLAPFRILSA